MSVFRQSCPPCLGGLEVTDHGCSRRRRFSALSFFSTFESLIVSLASIAEGARGYIFSLWVSTPTYLGFVFGIMLL